VLTRLGRPITRSYGSVQLIDSKGKGLVKGIYGVEHLKTYKPDYDPEKVDEKLRDHFNKIRYNPEQ
jgi:hypothetical protein